MAFDEDPQMQTFNIDSHSMNHESKAQLFIQEPELSFIINKYSLPRGLNSTKKLVEVNDSE